MKPEIKKKIWNAVFSVIFIVLLVLFGICLSTNNISLELGVFEFILLALATYRLIRLVVNDKVMLFFRDWFTVKEPTGIFDTIHDLITCPWCFGVWGALIIAAIYYLIPFGELFIIIMALAGLGTVFQLLANLVGWTTQYQKAKTQEFEKKTK